MPSENRLARHEFVRLNECRDERFVGLSPGIALRRSVDEMFTSARIQPRYGFVAEGVETVRGLATAGAGIAVLPARHGGPLPGSVEVPVAPLRHRHIGLLVSARRTLEPAAEGFRQWATLYGFTGQRPVIGTRNGAVRR
ncbi:LysR substrate-binding domain-containing protein [Dactylosporangium sp. CA-233914]|uniref:LysR substrate-binding domain-containing protein n=1 Tax=Dactylosporangium sp. CA-233914 TaxID=3239934 RepID=UPI003D8D6826